MDRDPHLAGTQTAGCHRAQSVMAARAIEAIESSDTDELLRIVDRLCSSRSWDDLMSSGIDAPRRWAVESRSGASKSTSDIDSCWRLRPRSLDQSWPKANHVCPWGPLPEVGQHKAMGRPGPIHPARTERTPSPPRAGAVRGERVDVPIPDLPTTLMTWEPAYPTRFTRRTSQRGPPRRSSTPPLPLCPRRWRRSTAYRLACQALGDLVEPWTDQSNGRRRRRRWREITWRRSRRWA